MKKAIVVGDEFPPAEVEKLGLEVKSTGTERLLGMTWNLDQDTWTPGLALNLSAKVRGTRQQPHMSTDAEVDEHFRRFRLSKRSLLGLSAQCWDPLGLWTPLTLKWKLIIREVIAKAEAERWDSPLDEGTREKAKTLAKTLLSVKEKATFPRHVLPPDSKNGTKFELVVYSDGSEVASGYCGYLCWTTPNGSRDSRLVAAGSRLTPVRVGVSIPKNELAALAYAARLLMWIHQTLQVEVESASLVSDSTTCLKQALNNPHLFNTPMSLFISEIQAALKTLTIPVSLYHCSSGSNMADGCSKSLPSAPQLVTSELWRKGKHLDRPKEERGWTEVKGSQGEVLPDMKKRYHRFVAEGGVTTLAFQMKPKQPKRRQDPLGDLPQGPEEESQTLIERTLDRTGSLNRTVGVLSWCLQWKHRDHPLKELRQMAMQKVMQDHRPRAMEGLDHYRVRKENILEKNGVMMVQRRLIRGSPEFQEFVPWVHPRSRLAAAILADHHTKNGHGVDIRKTVFDVSREFMIRNSFGTLTRLSARCPECNRMKRRPVSVILGPGSKLLSNQPLKRFSRMSIDPCGPFLVTEMRRKRKLFVYVSTCLQTGVLHASVAEDLSASSFLTALASIQANHGTVEEARLDNATGHSAIKDRIAEEQEESEPEVDEKTLRETQLKFRKAGVEFKFSSPRSPHENPSEAAVKIFKTTLKRMKLASFNLSTLQFVHFVEKAVFLANCSSIDPSPAVSRSSLLTKNSIRFNTIDQKTDFLEENHEGLAAEAELSLKLLKLYQNERDLATFQYLRNISKWSGNSDDEEVAVSDVVLINDKASNSLGGIAEVVEVFRDKTNQKVYQVRLEYLPPNKNNILGRWRRKQCLRSVRGITILIKAQERSPSKTLSLAELCFLIANRSSDKSQGAAGDESVTTTPAPPAEPEEGDTSDNRGPQQQRPTAQHPLRDPQRTEAGGKGEDQVGPGTRDHLPRAVVPVVFSSDPPNILDEITDVPRQKKTGTNRKE